MGRPYIYSGSGPHGKPGAGRVHRGSKRRLKRITLRGNWSVEFWVFVLAILIALFVLVPWLINHPIGHHHP
jgi:hypothetical protein